MTITQEKKIKKKAVDDTAFELPKRSTSPTHEGLCSTCVHRHVCSLTDKKPVIQCEEFLAEGKGKSIPIKNNIPVDYGSRIHSKLEEKFQGLCVNCENRYDCPSSCTEGGIWYCEEYR